MKLSRILVLLLVVAGVGGGLYWYKGRQAQQAVQSEAAKADKGPTTTANEVRFAPDAPQLTQLRVAAVAAYPEPLLDPLNGRVAYDENYTARIATPIAGRVLSIAAQPGDMVRAGQPLLQLDSPDYGSALADVAKSVADMRLKQGAFDRAKSLFEGEVLARKDFESAQSDLSASQAENRRAQERLQNLTQGKAMGDGKFALRTPIGGVISERKVNPGAEVRPDASDPLFVVTDPTHLWIIVDVPEKYLGKVTVGQRVGVETDAYPGMGFDGRVASIGEVLDPSTRRVQVRCVIDNPQNRLKPEMFVRVTPMLNDDRKLVRIPNSALITDGLYSHVFVEAQKGVFQRRRISLGLQGREESYVKDGLNEGERIVTSGAMLLSSELSGNN